MRKIDLATWTRRDHFDFFRNWDYPHFNLCANVDITHFAPALKAHGEKFTIGILYAVARVANKIPEFRHRIHNNEVVEYPVVHPASTIMAKDDLFTFCTFPYTEDFNRFARRAEIQIERIIENPTLDDGPDQDQLLFMTSIPWVSFTSFMHPLQLYPADSNPRFAWGKYFEEGGRLKMPISVQGHHALMDGLHVGRFYQLFQELLDEPEYIFRTQELDGV